MLVAKYAQAGHWYSLNTITCTRALADPIRTPFALVISSCGAMACRSTGAMLALVLPLPRLAP
jgi:hypothetical protein